MGPKNDVLEVYSFRSASVLAWELTSVQLRFAMEVLFRRTKKDFKFIKKNPNSRTRFTSLHPVYLMLAGFMMEALLKAILLKQKKDLTNYKNHNLLNMANVSGIPFSKDE